MKTKVREQKTVLSSFSGLEMSVTQFGFSRKQSLTHKLMYTGTFLRNVTSESRGVGQDREAGKERIQDALLSWPSPWLTSWLIFQDHQQTHMKCILDHVSRNRRREVFLHHLLVTHWLKPDPTGHWLCHTSVLHMHKYWAYSHNMLYCSIKRVSLDGRQKVHGMGPR